MAWPARHTAVERKSLQVTGLYCEVDGNFPNHHPDPSKPDNLKT
jgi:phosphomannomutase